MEGETVSPYSEWVGWSGVVPVVEGGSLAYLTNAGRKLGRGGLVVVVVVRGIYCLVQFCYDFFFFDDSSNLEIVC